jgi:FAD dependent oxidoreductase TIGR03364
MRVIVVGGGVLGTLHARAALSAGYEVIHVERDPLPSSASVRNFGLIWIGGRASGEELAVSLRTRELWEEISREIPDLTFRANGSLTLVRTQAELKVLEESIHKNDAAERQWKILDKKETQELNPALKGEYLASLWSPLDATVEPGKVLTEIRLHLLKNENYTWRTKVEIVDVHSSDSGAIAISREGEEFVGDFAIVTPGADHTTLFRQQLESAPLRKVYLQMMSTAPFDEVITTSIADADSLRYYPAYDVPSLKELPAQHPIATENHMQLLLVQRSDGTLTIGDTHAYQEPFNFKLDEAPYTYLHQVASELIGRELPPITNRWSGIYSQRTDGAICDRRFITPNVVVVTGPGGRGNTLAPAIAEQTIKELIA